MDKHLEKNNQKKTEPFLNIEISPGFWENFSIFKEHQENII